MDGGGDLKRTRRRRRQEQITSATTCVPNMCACIFHFLALSWGVAGKINLASGRVIEVAGYDVRRNYDEERVVSSLGFRQLSSPHFALEPIPVIINFTERPIAWLAFVDNPAANTEFISCLSSHPASDSPFLDELASIPQLLAEITTYPGRH